MSTSTTDLDLLKRVQRYLRRLQETKGAVTDDDIAVWNSFYPRYNRIVSNFVRKEVRRLGLPAHSRADVLQSVWEGVLRQLRKFEHDGRSRGFRNLLQTITKNTAISHVRKLRGRSNGHKNERTGESSLLRKHADVAEHGPEAESEHHWNEEMVREAYQQLKRELPEVDFEVFRRCHIEGEPPTIVAFDLGLTPETVRKKLQRARQRVREILRDLLGPDVDAE